MNIAALLAAIVDHSSTLEIEMVELKVPPYLFAQLQNTTEHSWNNYLIDVVVAKDIIKCSIQVI